MTAPLTPEQIAAKLTKAQRDYLTSKAKWDRPVVWAQQRWMTFPPPNTHKVLRRLGLVNRVGEILELGFAVRKVIGDEA